MIAIAAELISPAAAASNLLTEAPDLTGFSQAGLDRVTAMLDREVGQGHLAVGRLEAADERLSFGVRESPDEDVARDPVRPRIRRRVHDPSTAGVADQHNRFICCVDEFDHRRDVIVESDGAAVGVARLESGQGDRVHAMPRRFEVGSHLFP